MYVELMQSKRWGVGGISFRFTESGLRLEGTSIDHLVQSPAGSSLFKPSCTNPLPNLLANSTV